MAKAAKRVATPSTSTVATTRALRRRFEAAYADGMAALRRTDYDAMETAIRREEEILRAHRALIDEQRAALQELHQHFLAGGPNPPKR